MHNYYINFISEYFHYIRPLTTLVAAFAHPTRPQKSSTSLQSNINSTGQDLDRKQRHKPVSYKLFDSNYTISHEDEIKKQNTSKKVSSYSKTIPAHWNYEFELIKCQQFESRAMVIN